jgi:hypothetical protein
MPGIPDNIDLPRTMIAIEGAIGKKKVASMSSTQMNVLINNFAVFKGYDDKGIPVNIGNKKYARGGGVRKANYK